MAVSSCQTKYMAPTTSDESTWTIRIGRTLGEFQVGTETDYDDEGCRFSYEYTYLDPDAVVDVLLERTAPTTTYREALQQARGYASAVVGTTLIVQVNVSRNDSWSFITTGWLPNDEAADLLDSACAV